MRFTQQIAPFLARLLTAALLGLVPASYALAQTGLVAPVYGWTAYVSHATIVDITHRGNECFVVTKGGVFIYNIDTEEYEQFSTIEGLSRIDPTTIYGDPETGLVFIGFRNGMINFLDEDNRVSSISDIERSELFTTKTINRMVTHERLLYIATEFGIVVYDIDRQETRLSITKVLDNPTGSPVSDIAIANGRLYGALGSRGLFSVSLSEANIAQPWAWREETGLGQLPGGSSRFVCSTGDILFAQAADTIFRKNPGDSWAPSNFPVDSWEYLNSTQDHVFGIHGREACFLGPDSTMQCFAQNTNLECAYVAGSTIFVGDSTLGMYRWVGGFKRATPEGPFNNFVSAFAAGNGELYIAPRGRKDYSSRWYDKSGVPYFNLQEGGWKMLDHRDGPLVAGEVYQDFARAYYDKRTGKAYLASWGEGIVVLENGELDTTYWKGNSGIPNAGADVRVSSIAADQWGNVWFTQMATLEYPLNVLTAEGEWYSFNPYEMGPTAICIDAYDNKWVVDNGRGLLVFNDNQTPDNPADDRYFQFTTSFGQGGLPSNNVYAVVEDLDEQIWIGTSEGVTVFYDPSTLWTNDFQDAACPIIDGFCLLRDQQVNAIAVDGANRKWIATENGVYLVNLDGTELLEHFTVENSPLFDNDVKAVAVDHTTGEVFFGTAKGTLSYIGDAIDGQEDASELFAYPNPVYQDFEGPIMIRGMREFSTVKVVTPSGRLVRELDSNGGEITWDCRDTYGNKVNPGIYLLMVGDQTGGGTNVTQIAILERVN